MNVSYFVKRENLIVRIIGEIDHHSSEMIREKIEREYVRQNVKNIILIFQISILWIALVLVL